MDNQVTIPNGEQKDYAGADSEGSIGADRNAISCAKRCTGCAEEVKSTIDKQVMNQ